MISPDHHLARDAVYRGTFTPANFTGNLTGMTAADMESMLMSMDNFYVNVHTTANPAGEIRGQLYMESMGPSMAPGMAPMPGMEPSMSPGSKMSPGAMSPSSKMSPGMSPSSMSPGSSPPPSGAGRASSTLLALVALVAGVSMLA